jgi:hypothetical protein
MSEWPKTYFVQTIGELIKFKDFESLLNHAADTIFHAGNHNANSVEEVKQNLLQFLKEAEND